LRIGLNNNRKKQQNNRSLIKNPTDGVSLAPPFFFSSANADFPFDRRLKQINKETSRRCSEFVNVASNEMS